ncbi:MULTISPECIES: aspartate dehydrogenase [unclassified Vibrio]|uniref:L-aspartate dehydrogenase n=1 Tax=Vibrio sp. HB236076 TaxID=3232307 RepID=A0AB39HHJ3_9VIBR|nr:aspartate dehydrogenase [Vibrio sp. HB161653]MDP5255011.1 aspartate dehydrogenase [Vibrio sp. HB161653]
MKRKQTLKVAIIGLGAVGETVAVSIENGLAGNIELVSILCREKQKYIAKHGDKTPEFRALITDNYQTLLDKKPDIIVEAAGQATLNRYGVEILDQGIDLVVSSIGLFTNDDIFDRFVASAAKSGAQILLSSGALPAIDWMSAAALAQVKHVSISQTKPTHSWRGTAAEQLIDLDAITESSCFFEGTAREAANIFPKSSNITAMLALATAGLDRTTVSLFADPINALMKTEIDFKSNAGSVQVGWQGIPSNINPSTSADVPLAIVKALKNRASPVHYGA